MMSSLLKGLVDAQHLMFARTVRISSHLPATQLSVFNATRASLQFYRCFATAARAKSKTQQKIGKPVEIPIKQGENTAIPIAKSETEAKSIPKENVFKKYLSKDMISALTESFNISNPTEIQQLCIPEILKGKNVLCAAQTGTGKTLAYLLPIIQSLKNQEAQYESMLEKHKEISTPEKEVKPLRRMQRPRTLIIAPSKALVSQILVQQILTMFSHF